MPLTLAVINEYEERLRRELMERECLLAALQVLRGYAAKGECPSSLDFGPLLALLAPPARDAGVKKITAPAPGTTAVLPPPPPVKQYIHPDLELLGYHWGSNTAVVQWAIDRMGEDFSLTHIQQLLKREGRPTKGAEISVVLTRLKRTGRIEEIECGRGPKPAVFRKPECSVPLDAKAGDSAAPASATPAAAAA